MNISFIDSKLLNLSFQSEDGLEDNLDLKYSSAYPDDDKKKFITKFDVTITSKEGFSISLEYAGFFETDEDITDEFQNGHFITVNAPAITFPYLRSFVSTFTINAGLPPVVLPTINFQALAKNSDKV